MVSNEVLTPLDGFGFRQVKGFSQDWVNVAPVRPITVVVGKNNSGKSTMLDALAQVFSGDLSNPVPGIHSSGMPDYRLEACVTEASVKRVFPRTTSGGEFGRYKNHEHYGLHYVGKKLTWEICGDAREPQNLAIGEAGVQPELSEVVTGETYLMSLARGVSLPCRRVLRVGAERDIKPEPKSTGILVEPSGEGATNLIRHYLTQQGARQGLVEHELLEFLNGVCEPDSSFERISCLERDDVWEVYLHERGHGAFPVSSMGSGLKTILLVGIMCVVGPEHGRFRLGSAFLSLEEPENNLHPAQIRRLMHYVNRAVRESGMAVGIATHSGVVIDFFAREAGCALYHAYKTEQGCTARPIIDYSTRRDMIDDIGIRASEALQSNGIIWCEGPSDRIYLLSWLRKWGSRDYIEGRDFTIMFYGGRLLSWLSGGDPDRQSEAVSILGINRNLFVLIDSDMRDAEGRINDTKQRIVNECKQLGGHSWVTWGREVENYIDPAVLKSALGAPGEVVLTRYGSVFEDLESQGVGAWRNKKPELARRIGDALVAGEAQCIGDLEMQLRALEESIGRWNRGCWPAGDSKQDGGGGV